MNRFKALVRQYSQQANRLLSPRRRQVTAVSIMINDRVTVKIRSRRPQGILSVSGLLSGVIIGLGTVEKRRHHGQFSHNRRVIHLLNFSPLFMTIVFFTDIFRGRRNFLTGPGHFFRTTVNSGHVRRTWRSDTSGGTSDCSNRDLSARTMLVVYRSSTPYPPIITPTLWLSAVHSVIPSQSVSGDTMLEFLARSPS